MKKTISILLIFNLLIIQVFAFDNLLFEEAYINTLNYIKSTVESPTHGSIGGEWAVIGLARCKQPPDDSYFQNYYKNLKAYVIEKNGVLHNKKYTEYSRVILALTAIGKNPEDIEGFNLLTPLGDYEKTIAQGLNGPIWALIALDCKNYEMPQNTFANTQATRDMYINRILDCQLDDGGWSLTGGTALSSEDEKGDADITGMALQALAKYQDIPKVKEATEKALTFLSEIQDEDGGFSNYGTKATESNVQVLVALSELGISPNDNRFIKNRNSVLDCILKCYTPNGFLHSPESTKSDLMSTEQAFYGLVSIKRKMENKNTLYSMSDSISISEDTTKKIIFSEKDVSLLDIDGHKNEFAIKELAKRAIINGKDENTFKPDAYVTRAEFAALIIRALAMDNAEISENNFSDISEDDWYFSAVNISYINGITNGTTESTFNPHGMITREEAGTMLSRAAKLCGLNTEITATVARDILAGFIDYITISEWAAKPVAISVRYGIFDENELEIRPKEYITRAETTQCIYNLLRKADII